MLPAIFGTALERPLRSLQKISGVLLHPPRMGIMQREFTLEDNLYAPFRIEHNRPATARALIDREDAIFHDAVFECARFEK